MDGTESEQGIADGAVPGRPSLPARPTRVAVIIATTGRPEFVPLMAAMLDRQTRRPDRLIFSAVGEADLAPCEASFPVERLYGQRGLTRQRNRGLDRAMGNADVVVFFDDDFIPAATWLERAEQLMCDRPDVACVTGDVVADGINGPGFRFDEGRRIVDAAELADCGYDPAAVRPYGAPYGCNMAFRTSMIGSARFDERLPLYGWQEDLDFGARVGLAEKTVLATTLQGVHLGVKSGRVSGLRLGASQIINNAYLVRKGTMPLGRAVRFGCRNIAANLRGSFGPQRHIDRRGRLRGNLIGLWRVATGRLDPEYVETL